jgi:hypothetical protein
MADQKANCTSFIHNLFGTIEVHNLAVIVAKTMENEVLASPTKLPSGNIIDSATASHQLYHSK